MRARTKFLVLLAFLLSILIVDRVAPGTACCVIALLLVLACAAVPGQRR